MDPEIERQFDLEDDPIAKCLKEIEIHREILLDSARTYLHDPNPQTEYFFDTAAEEFNYTLDDSIDEIVQTDSSSKEKLDIMTHIENTESEKTVEGLNRIAGDKDLLEPTGIIPAVSEEDLKEKEDDEILEIVSGQYRCGFEEDLERFKYHVLHTHNVKEYYDGKEYLPAKAKEIATIAAGIVLGGFILDKLKKKP